MDENNDQMMLIQSFKQLVRATGMEMPVSIEAEIAAVEGGKRMSNELQRALAEASMNMMNQLRPETMEGANQGSVSDTEMQMYKDSLTPNTGMTDAQRRIPMDPNQGVYMPPPQPMPSAQGIYGRSSGVTVDPSAAPMTSPRPPARPMKQEAIMAEINVANMEENAELFMAKMGFPHDADGLNMTEEQLVNFVLLCQQEYMLGGEDEYEEDCDCEHGEDCDCHHDEMMMPEEGDVKVKVMRLGSGNVHELMNEILGGH